MLRGKVEYKVKSEKLISTFKIALGLADNISKCDVEIDSFLNGLSGGFIEPGPSGALTRGRIDALPTGRNFYAVNPRCIPTRAAWKIGVETAEKLIEYYRSKHGRYPETIGHWLWSLDAYKADGEQLSQILYLMGVRPVWSGDGTVKRLEVIPLSELRRPRIDNIIRISAILRDTLMNIVEMIDEAISLVIGLDEAHEENYVKKHFDYAVKKLMEMGFSREEAELKAKMRVYGSPPGAYGAGVNLAIEASAWRSSEDLAKIWIQWTGYAYGKGVYGVNNVEGLMVGLKTVDVVTRNHASDEHDPLNCCCYFANHGGFYNAVKALTNRNDVEIAIVDTRDVCYTHVRDMKSEIERIVRAKLLNPLWISEMKKHGYRGASEFSKKILHLYGWSASARIVDDWVFNEIASTYVLNEEMRKWFMDNNAWALEEITRRLIEAAERGLWGADEDTLKKLRSVYGEIEGLMEEQISTPGMHQGGAINIVSPEDYEEWERKLTNINRIWNEVKR
ncbi:MAG: cobaltochelatase subunit CobN [Candidatus Nezhaarchaeales archaeon]